MKSFNLNLLLIISLAVVIAYLLFNRCTCLEKENTKENMTNLNPAPIGFNLSDGVPGDKWAQHRTETLNSPDSDDIFKRLANIEAGQVPLPEGQLNFFYANRFDPKCCFKPQNYSSSTGCACISEEQMRFLNERGGNNNMDDLTTN